MGEMGALEEEEELRDVGEVEELREVEEGQELRELRKFNNFLSNSILAISNFITSIVIFINRFSHF